MRYRIEETQNQTDDFLRFLCNRLYMYNHPDDVDFTLWVTLSGENIVNADMSDPEKRMYLVRVVLPTKDASLPDPNKKDALKWRLYAKPLTAMDIGALELPVVDVAIKLGEDIQTGKESLMYAGMNLAFAQQDRATITAYGRVVYPVLHTDNGQIIPMQVKDSLDEAQKLVESEVERAKKSGMIAGSKQMRGWAKSFSGYDIRYWNIVPTIVSNTGELIYF